MKSREKNMYNILIVEDAREIYEQECAFLESEGFSTKIATTQEAAIALLEDEKNSFDLALVDLRLPEGGHGFTVATTAKERDVPVIFLTAMDDENTTVTGLSMGDDYIVKHFRRKELLARIRKVLSNRGKMQTVLTCRDIVVNTAKSTVYKNGQEVFLTRLEYKLLLVFMRNIGVLVTRDQLFADVYDVTGSEFITENTLNVHIKRLRGKLEDDPQNPQFIQTVRGLGYKIEK